MPLGDVREGQTLSPPRMWGSFLPSSGYSRGGCVALATGSAMGLWEVKNCTVFRARYICRQSLGTPVTPELPGPDPTPSLTGSCPQGWASDPKLRHCYKVGGLLAWGEQVGPWGHFPHSRLQTEVIPKETVVNGI